MKIFIALSFLFMNYTFGYGQNAISQIENPNSILIKISKKLNSLQNIRYDNTRELNYSSEDYYNISKWTSYYDFQSTDTVAGFKFQIFDSTSKQFFNGTEKFDLDLKAKTISIDDHPGKSAVGGLSAFYNSIITLKNVLPLLIVDKTATKNANDTSINGASYLVISLNIGKRRIQNLGFGFDVMTTKSDFIYRIIVEKNSYLPFEILQTNDINNDFIRTSFSNLITNTTPPSELSWYYSSYTNDFKQAGIVPVEQLVSIGSVAPDWKLGGNNSNKVVSLSDCKGQVVLLDFWIKNCGPCIQSVPHLNELQNRFKNKNFKLLSINSYDSEEDVSWFCKKHKAEYPVLLNGKSVAERYGVNGFPTFLIIDKTGKVIYTQVGYDESVQKEIERIIAGAL